MFKINLKSEQDLILGNATVSEAQATSEYYEVATESLQFDFEESALATTRDNLERTLKFVDVVKEATGDDRITATIAKEGMRTSLSSIGQSALADEVGTESLEVGTEAIMDTLKAVFDKMKEYAIKAWDFVISIGEKVINYIKSIFSGNGGSDTGNVGAKLVDIKAKLQAKVAKGEDGDTDKLEEGDSIKLVENNKVVFTLANATSGVDLNIGAFQHVEKIKNGLVTDISKVIVKVEKALSEVVKATSAYTALANEEDIDDKLENVNMSALEGVSNAILPKGISNVAVGVHPIFPNMNGELKTLVETTLKLSDNLLNGKFDESEESVYYTPVALNANNIVVGYLIFNKTVLKRMHKSNKYEDIIAALKDVKSGTTVLKLEDGEVKSFKKDVISSPVAVSIKVLDSIEKKINTIAGVVAGNVERTKKIKNMVLNNVDFIKETIDGLSKTKPDSKKAISDHLDSYEKALAPLIEFSRKTLQESFKDLKTSGDLKVIDYIETCIK